MIGLKDNVNSSNKKNTRKNSFESSSKTPVKKTVVSPSKTPVKKTVVSPSEDSTKKQVTELAVPSLLEGCVLGYTLPANSEFLRWALSDTDSDTPVAVIIEEENDSHYIADKLSNNVEGNTLKEFSNNTLTSSVEVELL